MRMMRRLGTVAAVALAFAVPAAAAGQVPKRLTVAPLGVKAGSTVVITAHGLRPGSRVRFMIGPPNSEADVIAHRTIGKRGRAAWVVRINPRLTTSRWVAVACQTRCRVTPFTVIGR